MDVLAESFSSCFSVSGEPNNPATPHPRMGLYKMKQGVPDQYVRRQKKLDQQRKKRQDFVNYSRKLVDGSLEQEDIKDPDIEEMEAVDGGEQKARRKRFNPYAYQLMLSEWLVDVPDDLAEEWLMVLCPFGKRNLIIAANGSTCAYTKSGFRVNWFTSRLPGGSPLTLKPGEYSILDCIFCEVTSTFFILDVMCWRGHPVFDTETEFRFYWLQTKLQETPGLTETSTSNPYKFIPLTCYPCTPESLKSSVRDQTAFKVDGFLFFHKRTHYTQGRTPLVGWLKPYMLPDILGIPVSSKILADAPAVNKLTLVKANKDLKDTTDDKTVEERAAVTRNTHVLEESMETGNSEQKKPKRKMTKGKGNAAGLGDNRVTEVSKMNCVTESQNCVTPESPEMDVDRKSRRRRRRGKKKTGEKMDTEGNGNHGNQDTVEECGMGTEVAS